MLAMTQMTVAPIGMPSAAFAQTAENDDDEAETKAEGPKTLGMMIADRDRAQMEKAKKKTNTIGGILGTVAGVGTALLCGAADRNNSDVKRLLCTAAGVAVAYTASLITKSIAKKLVEKDQRKVLVAASQSLRTGEPQELTLPDSSAVASVTPSGQPVFREAQVPIFYDSVRVTDLNKIKVIAGPYVVTKANTSVRAQPSATGKIVGKYPAKQPLYVSGQVDGSDWYMVSERVVENEDSAMMAVGYVEAKQLAPAAPNAVMPGRSPPPSMQQKDVAAILKCDQIGMRVRDAKGKTANGTSLLCLGPEGSPISA